MSTLARRIAAELGERTSAEPWARSQFGTLDQLMAEVQAQFGSGRAAARALGLGSEATWRRWRAGQTSPNAANLAKLESVALDVRAERRGHRIDSMTIKATQKAKDPKESGRQRTLDRTNLRLAPGAGERVARQYYRNGAEAAAVQYVKEVGERTFYAPMLALGIMGDWANGDGDADDMDDYEYLYDTAEEFADGDTGYGLVV